MTTYPSLIRASGFTLLELMISTALVLTISMIAAPSLNKSLNKKRLKADTIRFGESLMLARNYATAKMSEVVVCPLDKNGQCRSKIKANQNWNQGWQIYEDSNQNRRLDSREQVLLNETFSDNIAVVFNQNGILRFFPDGSSRSAGFYVCAKDQKAGSYLRLLHSGRLRLTSDLSLRQMGICQANLRKT